MRCQKVKGGELGGRKRKSEATAGGELGAMREAGVADQDKEFRS